MNDWFKKNNLYCILIILILGIIFLLISWFCFENSKDFLVFLASILIAITPYMIILINSIKRKKREEKRKKEKKIRKLERFYEEIREIIKEMQKYALETSYGNKILNLNIILGKRIIDLNYKQKYLKLFNCEVVKDKLFYAKDYLIDGYNIEIKYKGEPIQNNQAKINILLESLENIFKNEKIKIS